MDLSFLPGGVYYVQVLAQGSPIGQGKVVKLPYMISVEAGDGECEWLYPLRTH